MLHNTLSTVLWHIHTQAHTPSPTHAYRIGAVGFSFRNAIIDRYAWQQLGNVMTMKAQVMIVRHISYSYDTGQLVVRLRS